MVGYHLIALIGVCPHTPKQEKIYAPIISCVFLLQVLGIQTCSLVIEVGYTQSDTNSFRFFYAPVQN